MPLAEFMAAVQATGYQGDLSLEIFNDQFRAGSPRSIAIDGQRSLVYLTDQLRERDPKRLIPPLHGALLKNEQDVHLFERLAFMARRDGR